VSLAYSILLSVSQTRPSLSGFKLHTRFLHQGQRGLSMLRIETEIDGPRMILSLIGRIRSNCIVELRERLQSRTSIVILDLAEVDLVDVPSVRFLRDCQEQKIELRNCRPYILEWIRRERVEG
jgi:hypothetical protein